MKQPIVIPIHIPSIINFTFDLEFIILIILMIYLL